MAGAVVAVYNLYRTARQGALRRRRGGRRRRRSRPQASAASRTGIARSKRGRCSSRCSRSSPSRRRHRRVRADGARALERADDRLGQAVHAARDRRPRPLHPRRLRRLPLADDPAVARRDRALRRLLEGRGVRLRPSVPLGIEAHRTGSAARRRQVSGRLALRAHGGAARDVAAVDHAGLSVALRRDARYVAHRRQRSSRSAGSACRIRTATRSRRRPICARRRRRSPTGLTAGRTRSAATIARSSRSSRTCSGSARTSRRRRRPRGGRDSRREASDVSRDSARHRRASPSSRVISLLLFVGDVQRRAGPRRADGPCAAATASPHCRSTPTRR